MRISHWRSFAFLASGFALGGGFAISHAPPLSTHVLTVRPNSTVVVPNNLPGLRDLPKLLSQEGSKRWAILGGALLQSGLDRFSVIALKRAIVTDPSDQTLHGALGEALVGAHHGRVTDEAKRQFDIVLSTDPNDLVARFYIGYWLLQEEQPKPALVKWVGLMRAVGADDLWNRRLWTAMPEAAQLAGVDPLALKALCVAGM